MLPFYNAAPDVLWLYFVKGFSQRKNHTPLTIWKTRLKLRKKIVNSYRIVEIANLIVNSVGVACKSPKSLEEIRKNMKPL